VGCFLIATVAASSTNIAHGAALVGAAIGGIGGGFLWTAQGSYFGQAAEEHAAFLVQDIKLSTAYFAGIFAFVYLAEEVLLRLLSTALLETGRISWSVIFGVYTGVAVVSTVGMALVRDYPKQQGGQQMSVFYKVTAAVQLLRHDPKMKYMIGLNSAFGLCGAFLNSYVNGQVVRVALNDPDSKYVGGLSALVAAVAAVMSLVLAPVAQKCGKGPVLVGGALCFFGVAFPFVVQPDAANWGWGGLIMVYTLQGMGRATFESTLKATFADYFSYEKEGAFANIILQNGLSSAIGYILSFRLLCEKRSKYCVEFSDGSLHNVLSFELLVIMSVIFAIGGLWRASILYKREQVMQSESEAELIENESGVSA
jgi:MFS family permease